MTDKYLMERTVGSISRLRGGIAGPARQRMQVDRLDRSIIQTVNKKSSRSYQR